MGDSHTVFNDKCLMVVRKVHKSKSQLSLSPLSIVITPEIIVEFGTNIEEIQRSLKSTRLPYFFTEIASSGAGKIYKLYRMATGAIPDVVVADIMCKSTGEIVTVSFNKDLKKCVPYRKMVGLTVYQQIEVPRTGDVVSDTSMLLNTVKSLMDAKSRQVLKLKLKASDETFKFISPGIDMSRFGDKEVSVKVEAQPFSLKIEQTTRDSMTNTSYMSITCIAEFGTGKAEKKKFRFKFIVTESGKTYRIASISAI